MFGVVLGLATSASRSVSTLALVDSTAVPDAYYNGSLTFSVDGNYMYSIDGSGSTKVFQYTLAGNFDISTITTLTSLSVGTNYIGSLVFSYDGTKAFIRENSTQNLKAYSLSTPWMLSSIVYENTLVLTDLGSYDLNMVTFSVDGLTMIVSKPSSNVSMLTYSLSTAYDIQSASYVGESPNIGNYSISGLNFTNDGYTLVILNDAVAFREYTLNSQYDITSLDLASVVIFELGLNPSQFPASSVHTYADKAFVMDANVVYSYDY